MTRAQDPQLELRLLGPLEVSLGGRLVPPGGPKLRALLVDLVVHLGSDVSVDRLVDDLWGDAAPGSAAHAVEVYVSQLRKSLELDRVAGAGAAALITTQTGYLLAIDPEAVDACRFERLANEGRDALRGGDAPAAGELLREALALWRGPALSDLRYEPFAQAEIARLEERRVEALEERIEGDLATGVGDELVPELEALVAEHPFREHLRAHLMLALYRAGRQADALAAYREARRVLLDELGLEPGPALREREQAILRHEPDLMPPSVGPTPIGEKRRIVTVVFVDVVESTSLASVLDPETFRVVLRRYFDLVSGAVSRHGGTLEKFIGDAAVAAFGVPLAQEDHALRAARAAAEIRTGVATLAHELRRELDVAFDVRIALESGEVVAGDPAAGEAFVSGSVVSLVARLEGAAEPGQILVGELAARLLAHAATLEPLAPLSLKGWSEPVSAYGLVEVGASAPGVARRLDARLVGRQRELDHLRHELKRASTTGTCRIVSVLGPAGIGKSRLAQELRAGLADGWRVLAGRCLSYGEGTSFGPLRALVAEGAGDLSQPAIAVVLEGDPEAARIAATLAAAFEVEDTPATADEISWAFRRFCESLARRQPLLVVLDDLHWASATLLGLVEQLAGASGPMLVAGLARQDLLEEHPLFLAGRSGTSALVLEELEAAETDSLVEEHVPGAPKALRARVREAAGGNPLFVEQLLAFVVETGGGDPTEIPPTIQALLAVRVDRLGPAERAVLERAAVLGREFRFDDVAALLDPGMGATARRHLDGLARRDFVRPDSVDELRFRNVLIREAVYRSIPKRDRAELHERTADLLHSRGGDEAGDELVGYHLEQAYRWRVDLGPPDRRARGLAAEAGARLGRAAIRAWKLGDVPAATGLFERAVALLPGDDPTRRELLCELGVALRVAGRVDQAEEALGFALEAASAAGDRRIELRATMELVGVGLLHEPEGRAKELLSVAEGAIPAFEAVGDDRALGRAWFLVGFVRGAVRCQNAAWEDAAQRALVHYGRSGWPTATCLGDIAAALYYGPTPVADALARCESLVATQQSPLGEANVVVFMGGLAAMCGRFDDARGHVERARFLYEELGHLGTATMSCGAVAGELEVLAGSPEAAADVLARSCEQLAELGGRSHLGSLAAQLADVLVALGREEESVRWLAIAEETTATDDVGAQLMTRAVRAKVRAREGRPSAARALAEEAVALAARTDWLNMHAKVLLDLAEVLEADGRSVDAAAPVEQALALYRLKGSSVAAERTQRRLDALRGELSQAHGRPRRGLP